MKKNVYLYPLINVRVDVLVRKQPREHFQESMKLPLFECINGAHERIVKHANVESFGTAQPSSDSGKLLLFLY